MSALKALGLIETGIAKLGADIEADRTNGAPTIGPGIKKWLGEMGHYLGKEGTAAVAIEVVDATDAAFIVKDHNAIEERKRQLAGLLRLPHDGIAVNEHFGGDGAMIYKHACALGCEGIVSKCLGTPYRAGRSNRWLKIKNPEAPAVRASPSQDLTGARRWLRSISRTNPASALQPSCSRATRRGGLRPILQNCRSWCENK